MEFIFLTLAADSSKVIRISLGVVKSERVRASILLIISEFSRKASPARMRAYQSHQWKFHNWLTIHKLLLLSHFGSLVYFGHNEASGCSKRIVFQLSATKVVEANLTQVVNSVTCCNSHNCRLPIVKSELSQSKLWTPSMIHSTLYIGTYCMVHDT